MLLYIVMSFGKSVLGTWYSFKIAILILLGFWPTFDMISFLVNSLDGLLAGDLLPYFYENVLQKPKDDLSTSEMYSYSLE